MTAPIVDLDITVRIPAGEVRLRVTDSDLDTPTAAAPAAGPEPASTAPTPARAPRTPGAARRRADALLADLVDGQAVTKKDEASALVVWDLWNEQWATLWREATA